MNTTEITLQVSLEDGTVIEAIQDGEPMDNLVQVGLEFVDGFELKLVPLIAALDRAEVANF